MDFCISFLRRSISRLFQIIWLVIALQTLGAAQNFISPDDYPVNGYRNSLSGLDFEYHSCIPGLRESLLLRATDGKDFIEWETEAVPAGIEKKYTTFVWIAALGSSPGNARMDLDIDDVRCFTFYTDGNSSWKIPGEDGLILSFNSIMTDQYGDLHGYMMLRIPAKKTTAGKSLRIKVTGSAANLSSWYMTFKKQVKTGVTLHPFPAIMKSDSGPAQLVEAGIFYFGEPADANILADGKLLGNFP